jgi:glycosyltransferase involved in cell wall biosynthesis
LIFATSTPLTIILPAVVAARRRAPIVFEVRDLWPEMPIAIGAIKGRASIRVARRLERFAYHGSAHIIALSPGIRDGILATGVPVERITVIPNAADLDLFAVDAAHARRWRAAQPGLDHRPMVLYCGTIGLVNDVTYLVEIAAAARRIAPEIAFVVIGDGAEARKVRDRAEHLGVLGQNLLLLPPIPKDEVPLAFAAATVSTSLFAPIPEMEGNSANKFFDGLASGTPVAINYGGWQQELLEAHGAGIRLPACDPSQAAHLLAELIADPARRERMGRGARELAEREFDRDALTARLAEVLREVHSGHA